jgi:hypothetical protein
MFALVAEAVLNEVIGRLHAGLIVVAKENTKVLSNNEYIRSRRESG